MEVDGSSKGNGSVDNEFDFFLSLQLSGQHSLWDVPMVTIMSCAFLNWIFGIYVGLVIVFSCWAQHKLLRYTKAMATFHGRENDYYLHNGADGEGSNAYQREVFYNLFRSNYPQFEQGELASQGKLIRIYVIAQVIMLIILIVSLAHLEYLRCSWN